MWYYFKLADLLMAFKVVMQVFSINQMNTEILTTALLGCSQRRSWNQHLSNFLQTFQHEAVMSQCGQLRLGDIQAGTDVQRKFLLHSKPLGVDQSPIICKHRGGTNMLLEDNKTGFFLFHCCFLLTGIYLVLCGLLTSSTGLPLSPAWSFQWQI